jgi:hypothetical protein
MLLATAGVALLLARREAPAGAALVAAVAVKSAAAFVAPFALVAAARQGTTGHQGPTGRIVPSEVTIRPIDRRAVGRFAAGGIAAALVLALAAYLGFGWDWLHAFGLAGENQGRTSHMSIPVTFARLTGIDEGPVRTAALLVYAAALAYLLAWTWRGGDWVRAAAWAGFGLLLATSWLLPWYLVWPLPLVAVSRDRPLTLLVLALTAFQLGARIPL